jgi:hypothetical protein
VSDAVDIPPTESTTPVLRSLACPYCAGKIVVNLGWRGHGHLSEQVPDGHSCDDCGADWAKDGTPTCGPSEHCWRIGEPEGAIPPWVVTT